MTPDALSTDPLSQALAEEPRLVVKQKKHWVEILSGMEARAAYEICTERGEVVGRVGESGSFFARLFFKGRRPFTLTIESGGQKVLQLDRPWFWWLSTVHVQDGRGRLLGTLEQRWAFFQRRFELLDPSGNLRATVVGPFFKPWTFEVHQGGAEGPEVARIEKKWSGLLKEAFTDADTFAFSVPRDPSLGRLVLATALLVDFCYFENSSGEGGLVGLLTS
jgi:uncharacterized protein YxjI